MKTAQDFRIGNVMMLDAKSPMVVLKNEFCTSGRNAAISKLKLRNILTGQNLETAVKAMDKYEEEILDRKEVQYLYCSNDNYAFMDQESYETLELYKDEVGEETIQYLQEQMILEITYYGEKAVGIQLPNFVEMEIEYTEPGERGDTSGKVLKPATMVGGLTVNVPLFCESNTWIKIDTRTGENIERVKK